MAIPSAYSNYSTVATNAYDRFMGNTMNQPYTVPVQQLRQPQDSININFGANSPQDRIQQIADSISTGQQGRALGMRQAAQAEWGNQWDSVGSLSRQDQSSIYGSMRNTGLVPQSSVNFRDNQVDYKWRQQNPWYQQNLNTIGLSNRANLAQQGINPSSVQNSYNRFMGLT